jgi:DNA-binding transcriptional ArsR family regulator
VNPGVHEPAARQPAADERAGAVFAALADPTRRAMVHTLRAQPQATASRLAGELPMTH